MEIFTFLKNDYPDLYLLCADVAKYIETDNSISMLKARQAIELIVKYLGAETDDLFININNLEDKNIANFRIIELFHFIRKKANKSVHNETNSDTEGVLDALIEVCVWLAIGYDKKNISIIKFTDKEKLFLKKYGNCEVGASEENYDVSDTVNPLEAAGKFSDEVVETVDVLEQDVFETYEEYCLRIESLPATRIGYAFLDSSQIDDYCEIAFPLFHVSKHPKIESATVSAFYAFDTAKGKNIDGIIKAKLKIFKGKIYYDYDSVTLKDDNNEIKLFPISWEKYEYETEEEYTRRINKLPLLPMAIAKPIRKEYNLQKQILPFETISLSYASKCFTKKKIVCSIDRNYAKNLCLMKSPFKVYAHFKDLQPVSLLIYSQENDSVLIVKENQTIIKNFAESKFELYFDFAQRGNTNAQCNLARCFEYGFGVKENEKKAFEWYKIAAENGNTGAMYRLAECYVDEDFEGYEDGLAIADVKKDEKKAVDWLIKAAENGHIRGQDALWLCYTTGKGTGRDRKKAFVWCKRAAEQGACSAQYQLARFYEEGIETEIDDKKANEWKSKALYNENNGIVLEDDEILWVRMAARHGCANAQYKLAVWYLKSYPDSFENEFVKWCTLAAKAGSVRAQIELAHLYRYGSETVEINEELSFEWFKKVAEQGFIDAQYMMGFFYETGFGTEKDYNKSIEWYKRAAKFGYAPALEKLKELGEKY